MKTAIKAFPTCPHCGTLLNNIASLAPASVLLYGFVEQITCPGPHGGEKCGKVVDVSAKFVLEFYVEESV